ncbi:MAG: hypothetical protein ACE5JU_20765 [Candidatus Binatia bacterium]
MVFAVFKSIVSHQTREARSFLKKLRAGLWMMISYGLSLSGVFVIIWGLMQIICAVGFFGGGPANCYPVGGEGQIS